MGPKSVAQQIATLVILSRPWLSSKHAKVQILAIDFNFPPQGHRADQQEEVQEECQRGGRGRRGGERVLLLAPLTSLINARITRS